MTNKEWLDYLAHNAPDELAAWFDAERITNQAEMLHMPESHESATMQHIGQVIEDTVKRGVYGDTAAQDGDSREQLEADINSSLYGAAMYDDGFIPLDMVIGWLDRQAAITEREVCAWIRGKDAEHDERIHRVAELQQQVDRLTAERERYRSLLGKALDYADAIHALAGEIDEGMA